MQIRNTTSAGPMGKGCGTVFFLIFAAFGVGFCGLIGYAFVQNLRPYFWNKTDCAIMASSVTEKTDQNKAYEFTVQYQYEYAGRPYTSSVYRPDPQNISDYAKAERLTEQYPAGSRAVCRVNPEKPAEAALVPGSLWTGLFILLPLIFLAVGVGGIIMLWRRKKEGEGLLADGTTEGGAISAKARGKEIGAWVMFPFFGIFLAVGLGLFWWLFVHPVLKVREAQGWVETPCTILSSEVESHRGSKGGTTYSVEILYSYEFGGRPRKSSRYNAMTSVSSSGYEGKRAVVDRYPVGKQSVCFVNPNDPSEAYLNRDFTPDMWFGLFPLIFAFAGAGGLVFATHHALTRNRKQATIGLSADGRTPAAPADSGRRRDDEAEILEPGGARFGRLIGNIIFAVLWNGIISVFVWQVVAGWKKGEVEWGLALFLVPFVLIGLALIGGIFYYFLALFNPRPRLRIQPGRVPVGEELEIKWEVLGNVHRIGEFEISIEGREEVRYQSGKSTSTAKEVFLTILVFKTNSPREMTAGKTAVRIPPDTLPSFDAPNNKIIWTLRVQGDVAWWPDVKEEFPLTVLPVRLKESRA